MNLKFDALGFISLEFIAEEPRSSYFPLKFLGPLAQKVGVGSQNNCLQKKWCVRMSSIHMPSLVEMSLRRVAGDWK